jgi:hypothetical protein
VQNKLATNVTQGDKQTKHITLFKTYICPSCGRKLSANYRLVKGVSKIHIDALAELIPHLVQVQNHFQ